jgi:hypothetical protein
MAWQPKSWQPSSFEADAAPAPDVRGTESAARGALQGLSMGFGDEASAAIAAALPFMDREAAQGATLRERYQNAREFYRGRNTAAEKANPGTYLAGEMGGAVLGAGKFGASLPSAAGQGVARGLGYSSANDAAGLASDTALGGALGVAGHGAGQLVGKAAGSVANRAARLAGSARDRAGSQAANEVAEQIASARGALGAETQKGSRFIENLGRLEPEMSAAQRAALDAQRATVTDLSRSVAQGTLERLPGQAATIAERQAALETLTRAAPQATASRTQQLLTPQVGADTRSFIKAYGEPVVASYLGYKAADLAGMEPEGKATAAAAAGLIFGRTRAGKALKSRITRPAHQFALADALRRGSQGKTVAGLRRALATGAPAVVTQQMLTEDE